jgi:hypothetical protein
MENGDKHVMMIRHYENLLESIRTEYVENGNKYIMMVFHYEELLKRTHVEYAEKIEKLQKKNKDLTEKLNLSDDMVSMLVDKLLEKEKEKKSKKIVEKEKTEKIVEKTEKIKNTIRFLPYNKNTHAEKCKEYTMYLTYLENGMNTCYLWRDYKQILFCDKKIYQICLSIPMNCPSLNIKYIEFYDEKNMLCLPIVPPVFNTKTSCYEYERHKMRNYEILKENMTTDVKKHLLGHWQTGSFHFFKLNNNIVLSKIKIYSESNIKFFCRSYDQYSDMSFQQKDGAIKTYKNWTIVEQKEKENGFIVTTIYFFKTCIPSLFV